MFSLNVVLFAIYLFLVKFELCNCLPDEGKWNYNLTKDHNNLLLPKSLFNGTQIFVKLNCESTKQTPPNITISWVVVPTQCWDVNVYLTKIPELLKNRSHETVYTCDDHIVLKEEILQKDEESLSSESHPIYKVRSDGLYILGFQVNPTSNFFISNSDRDTDKPLGNDFNLGVHIEMKNSFGYISAVDYPLLPFYGIMCGIYVTFGLLWLFWSFAQWKDLLRVQFWIGAVIFLGMMEKATFYAEYRSVNISGVRVQGAMLFAEWVSCAKRTLARMLVVIVSLGFGIVKPRLGSTLHRVAGVGLLYFVLAAYESYLRVTRPKNEQRRDLLVASVPLAVLDSAICWWIFTALINTTRTLRLRRNEVKLTLYKHFTNTLIFSVIASVVFMIYSIRVHHTTTCLRAWKDLWVEEAFWHILFSVLLFIIMFLWRPTNNNQRYAFVQTFDASEDNDEEVEQLVNDAYGVKVRGHKMQNVKPQEKEDENLKWLEENVSTGVNTLPILDSDEELVNTRFEVSKMQ